MKRAFSIAALGLAVGVQQPGVIFRFIDFNFGRVELGATGPSSLFARVLDDSTRRLRNLTFGGAAAIDLRFNRRGTVTAILFRYDSTWQWSKEVADYTRGLGPPVVRLERVEVAEWRDTRTRFKVSCTRVPRGRDCRSELRDLESEALDAVEGSWRVGRAWFPGISAFGEKEAAKLAGRTIGVSFRAVELLDGRCSAPKYTINRSSRAEFESANRVRLASLATASDSVAVVDVACRGTSGSELRAAFVLVGAQTYLDVEGCYLQLSRVAR